MTAVGIPAPQIRPVRVPALAWVAVAFAIAVLYVMLQENGLLLRSWETVHELFHDGRHLLGVPCH
jgi:hypothetical protein